MKRTGFKKKAYKPMARISKNPANVALRKKKAKVKRALKWTSKKADTAFSIWIRERDGKCKRCGKFGKLTNSHFWGRTHSATRYDPENCDAFCWLPCHYQWEHEKQGAYRDFKINQLGQERYDALERRARSSMKRSEALYQCKQFLEEYGSQI